MLVLTRRMGEEISIPSLGVSIRVVSTQGNRTRIGIDAPIGLEIRRAELPIVECKLKVSSRPLEIDHLH